MTVALTALPSVCSSADPRSCRCRCRPPNRDSQDACRSGDYGAADSAVVVAAATAADGEEEDDDDAAFVAVVVVAAAVGGGDDALVMTMAVVLEVLAVWVVLVSAAFVVTVSVMETVPHPHSNTALD